MCSNGLASTSCKSNGTWPWTFSTTSGHKRTLDHILVRERFKSSTTHTETYIAPVPSDHAVLAATIRLRWAKTQQTPQPTKLDFAALKDPKIRTKFEKQLSSSRMPENSDRHSPEMLDQQVESLLSGIRAASVSILPELQRMPSFTAPWTDATHMGLCALREATLHTTSALQDRVYTSIKVAETRQVESLCCTYAELLRVNPWALVAVSTTYCCWQGQTVAHSRIPHALQCTPRDSTIITIWRIRVPSTTMVGLQCPCDQHRAILRARAPGGAI